MARLCKFGQTCRRPDCYFAHPEGRDIDCQPVPPSGPQLGRGMPSLASTAPGNGGGTPCRFGFACTRQDCYFQHPEGRAIDQGRDSGFSSSHPELDPDPWMMQQELEEAEKDQIIKDTWYPQARHCTCCKGFIFGCQTEICSNLGKCTCSLEAEEMVDETSSDL